MGASPLDHPPSFLQTDQPCSPRRSKSWISGLNISTVYPTALLPSMTTPSNISHKCQSTPKWTSHKCPLGKLLDRMPYLPKCTRQVALPCKISSPAPTMWEKEQLPQEFREKTIVRLHKPKGNCQSCDNHHKISLLCIAGKILASVLLNHLLLHLGERPPS